MTSNTQALKSKAIIENSLKIARWMLVIYCATAIFSISISQIAIFSALALWLFSLWHGRKKGLVQDISLPLSPFFIAFIGATLLAALSGYQPLVSLEGGKSLFHIGIFFFVLNVLNSQKDVARCHRLLLVAGMIASAIGVYSSLSHGFGLEHRAKGLFESAYAYMTFAGMLMMIFLVNISRILFSKKIAKETGWWEWAALFIILSGLLFSLTRNVWVGSIVGFFFLALLRYRKKALLFPLLLLLLYPILPPQMQTRFQSITDTQNTTNHERIVLWKNGFKMIADHPLLGVGQDNFQHLYDNYRKPEDKSMGNMHNSYLTILAERGIIGLIAWLSLIVALGWKFFTIFRETENAQLLKGNAAGTLSALIALMCAGFFESNFNDTEVNMLFYFLMALPFVPVSKKEEV